MIEDYDNEADKKKKIVKDDLQKESLADQARPKCKSCGKFTDRKSPPQCYGHGGGGGSDSEKSEEPASIFGDLSNQSELAQSQSDQAKINNVVVKANEGHGINFNIDLINDLISGKFISIQIDRDNSDLAIEIDSNKWHTLPPGHQKQLQAFMKEVIKEFNEFKKDLSISDQNKCHLTLKDDRGRTLDTIEDKAILSIHIKILDPSLKLFDKFIDKLNLNANLNKALQFAMQQNSVSNQFANKVLHSKDYSNENDLSKSELAEKSQEQLKSIRPKSPADGPKPKGWTKI